MSLPTIAFFGSSLVSAYWNGAATYYRGIVRALHRRGYQVTFYEPDAYDRQAHRDIPDPEWARISVYPATLSGVSQAVASGAAADIVIKTSGVGVFDAWLDAAVLDVHHGRGLTIFWDVDAPATLDRLAGDPDDPFHVLIPDYDVILTYGGGAPVVRGYTSLGARACVPIYNAVDPDIHHPVARDDRFAADLALLANRLPDREARIDEFFFRPAAARSGRRFVLGGSGWGDRPLPAHIDYVGHVYTRDHNAFNSTPLAVLNVSRESMARVGHSPATRVFEAAGAAACLITDAWDGVEQFLEPGREVLVAADGEAVGAHLDALTPERAATIGAAARARVLATHTYDRRVDDLEAVLGVRSSV